MASSVATLQHKNIGLQLGHSSTGIFDAPNLNPDCDITISLLTDLLHPWDLMGTTFRRCKQPYGAGAVFDDEWKGDVEICSPIDDPNPNWK
ncbi:hypothetical protein N7522_004450 [Penicillium canescens]|nr:hypothetical protein N7522_004450 [Penicillium canescens]